LCGLKNENASLLNRVGGYLRSRGSTSEVPSRISEVGGGTSKEPRRSKKSPNRSSEVPSRSKVIAVNGVSYFNLSYKTFTIYYLVKLTGVEVESKWAGKVVCYQQYVDLNPGCAAPDYFLFGADKIW